MKNGRADSSARRPGTRPRLFISYRRRHDTASARLLKKELERAFGEDAVFRDVDDITPGEDFPESIREAVESCGVFLPLISPGWVEVIGELRDPDDFVRREIAAALARKVPLIPVLLGGARMPKADEMPEEIRDLAFRQAIELSDDRWDYDVARLVKLVRTRAALSEPPSLLGRTAALRTFLGTRLGKATAAAAVVAAVVIAFFVAANLAIWYEHFGRDFEGCVRLYTPDVLGGAASIRSGTYNAPVVSADRYDVILRRRHEPDGIPLMLRLSDSGSEVGVVFFRFFKAEKVEDGEFRVERVIEPKHGALKPKCADVQDYYNSDRPAGDKRVLKNWDRLGVRLGGRDYLLRPNDHGDYIVATLSPMPADVQAPWR